MTKPDFTQMTRRELKTYIRQHPTDDEAFRELFVNRRHPDAKTYPYPNTPENEEIMRQAIREKIEKLKKS